MESSIDSMDVPQQDDLIKVRAVVRALRAGVARSELGQIAGLSGRHVRYTLHAARTLGLTRQIDDVWSATEAAGELLEQPAGSPAERAWLFRSIADNAQLMTLAPSLLERDAPTLDALAGRLQTLTGLAQSTAQRRALTLLSWRDQVIEAAVEVAPTPTLAPTPPREHVGPPRQMGLFD